MQKIIISTISIISFFLILSKKNDFVSNNNSKKEIAQDKINSLDQIVEENKGKVIYVDFWASWCAPCIKELSKSLKLHKKYGEKVAFVYLSIDLDEKEWKEACTKESLSEFKYNFMTMGFKKSAALNGLKIQAVPHYLIFDKSGKLVNSNAPSPGDKRVKEELEKYL